MVKIFINAFSVVLILILGYKEFSRMIAIKSSILYLIGELLVVPIVIINESVYDMEVFYVDSITSTWLMRLMISRVIVLVFIQIFRNYNNYFAYKTSNFEKIILYLPLVITFVAVVYFIIIIEEIDRQSMVVVLFILSIILMLYIVTYIKFFENLILLKKRENEIVELQHCSDMQCLFYEQRNEYEEEIKKIQHDLKNHLLIAKQGQKDEYIEALIAEIDDDFTISSGNRIFDILINSKRKDAVNENIEFNVNVLKNISEINFIPEQDLCSIFGNLLDNAIEHCDGGDKSKSTISITVNIINGFFIMNINNSFNSEKIRKSGNELLTTKSDVYLHGIGLKSLNTTVEKYDGVFKLEYKGNIFKTTIMIPLHVAM